MSPDAAVATIASGGKISTINQIAPSRNPIQVAGRASLAARLTYVGLLTISWDRIAAIPVKTYHLKLPYLCFGLAVLVSVLFDRRLVGNLARVLNPAYTTIASILFLYVLAALGGISRSAGIGQVGTVIGGALLPLCAIIRVARRQGGPQVLLKWFIRGGVIAAWFGLYQLVAFYLHLPQGVTYTGQVGGFGRIAGMSYEPAYFADYLVLVIASILAYRRLADSSAYGWALAICAVSLVLSNSRATLIMIPVLVFAFRPQVLRSLRRRTLVRMAATVVVAVAVVALGSPATFGHLRARVASIANTKEPTSNAPRLKQYHAELEIIRGHWVTGIGPGSLYKEAARYGWDVPSTWGPNQVVANNIWLQAAVDGGILLLLAEAALIVRVAVIVRRHASATIQLLWAGWLAVILVGGMLTSIYFEIELWVVLGLLLASLVTLDRDLRLMVPRAARLGVH